MGNKDIEKAALKYKAKLVEDVINYNNINNEENNYEAGKAHALDDFIEDSFKEGVKWFISSMLHDIDEEPSMGRNIMVLFKRGGYASWLVSSGMAEDFKEFNVIKWAHIDDVIRNMEEYYNDQRSYL